MAKAKSDLVQEFIDMAPLYYRSTATIRAYAGDVRAFTDWLADTKRNLKRVTGRDLDAYLMQRRESGAKGATVARNYNSVKAWWSWLLKHGMVTTDIFAGRKRPKYEKPVTRVPSQEEMGRLLAAADGDSETELRLRAMLELFYSSGLRVSELCNARVTDLRGGTLRIVGGKGDKSRDVPVTDAALEVVQRYLAARWHKEVEWLFTSTWGRKLSISHVYRLIVQVANRAGIDSVHPHTLRHAAATHLLEGGADLRMIQEFLGHASMTSTAIYTTVTKQRMQEIHKTCHPRRGI